VSNRTDICLRPSLSAGAIAGLPWLTVLIATLVLGSNGLWQAWYLSPLALLGLTWQVRNSGLLRGKSAVTALQLRGDELWAQLGSGDHVLAKPAADSRLGAGVTLLKLALPTSPYSPRTVVLLAGDWLPSNVQREPFRQLRVWLRLRSS